MTQLTERLAAPLALVESQGDYDPFDTRRELGKGDGKNPPVAAAMDAAAGQRRLVVEHEIAIIAHLALVG